MIGAPGPRPVPSGLGARIIGFLSIALVPIGLVAYFQTTELERETRARSQLSLSSVTEGVAAVERDIILRASGAAQALGSTSRIVEDTGQTCNRFLSDFQQSSGLYTFAGVLTPQGEVLCASHEVENDLSEFSTVVDAAGRAEPAVLRIEHPAVSRQPIILVMEPFYRESQFDGHVVISIPVERIRSMARTFENPDVLDVVTFNNAGQILSSTGSDEAALALLPPDARLSTYRASAGQSFLAESADGEARIFAVATVVPGRVQAISIWPRDSTAATSLGSDALAKSLPLLMWAASVVVAYLAINRLVIRHILTLRYQMRSFARDRRVPDPTGAGDMALELRDMENDFLNMADSILQDEAQLENALREKTILVKEVHHRVKNNLQLISSIMNMQIRQSAHQETRTVLKRLQERIRGLATIHRNLYQTGSLSHVDTRELLEDLIAQMTLVSERDGAPLVVETDIAAIDIYPDQAVPLSLLTSEALTNAAKYLEHGSDEADSVTVSLSRVGERDLRLDISNSCLDAALDDSDTPREGVTQSGLGNRLIQAFATQLGGTLHQGVTGDRYAVTVIFSISDFKPEAVDY